MKNIVVLTGAGISAESGVRTFRGSDGLWEEHRVEDIATFEAWERNPKLVREFYNQRRKQLYEVNPNKAHFDLVKLEKDFNTYIITQNIDDLHERAGSKNILHLHGELKKVRSVVDENDIIELEGWELKERDLDKYGKPLRPHIVWFGEAVPMFEKAIEISEKADIMIVIGTSLQVYPAAGLINYAPKDCKIYLIDPKEPNMNLKNIKFIKEKASIGVEIAVNEILEKYK